jgi:ribosomal protein S18 acetylase RimI-like enzyme
LTNWTIRRATGRDAGAVAGLWTETYVAPGTGGRTAPYTEADFLDSARHGAVFVAEQKDAIVGVVVLYEPGASGRAISECSEAELTRLAVAPAVRRMGIGRALARLCQEGVSAAAIVLWSRPAQVEAHRLYESLGYRRVPERDSVDEAGAKRLVFRLALAPPGN